MKIGGSQYLDGISPEEFLYLKSFFAIKNARLVNTVFEDKDYFSGDLYGVTVISSTFKKGKYTL